MTDFEGQVWVIQEGDNVNFVCITKRAKGKIQAINDKGRELRLSEDKLLWQHPIQIQKPENWQGVLTDIQSTVYKLRSVIDVVLLWETASELEVSEVNELADLYFSGEITIEHLVALWRAIAEERLHFKRRGKIWETRSAEQVVELQNQRERERTRAKEQAFASQWLQSVIRSQTTIISEEIRPFVKRLENWLYGSLDKEIEELVAPLAVKEKCSHKEFVFEILQKIGCLSENADRDVIVAGLKPEFSMSVNEAAQAILPWLPTEDQNTIDLLFSIDDEETREVDDALAIEREGHLWKVTIAIADPTYVVQKGDVLDREAMRRGTTVYLPTQTILMLPERISCDLASLTEKCPRSSIVICAWLDDEYQLVKSSLGRKNIRVLKRFHYNGADALITDENKSETAQHLRELFTLAIALRNQRNAEGAFTLPRSEYKVRIKDNIITVTVIDQMSPSRILVGEMMILANYIAASYAHQHLIPIIYRIQNAPIEPITPEMIIDPSSSIKIRKLLRPSMLSLEPGSHSGLGLPVYTQLTSPLRRFADLVIQRQLIAHLAEEVLPYNRDELLKVLETAERTTREARIFESDAKRRWFIKYLQQAHYHDLLDVLVVDTIKGGYKVEIMPWGVDAFLSTPKKLEVGKKVTAVIDKTHARMGNIRLKLKELMPDKF